MKYKRIAKAKLHKNVTYTDLTNMGISFSTIMALLKSQYIFITEKHDKNFLPSDYRVESENGAYPAYISKEWVEIIDENLNRHPRTNIFRSLKNNN
jgi:hypothetical protein